MKLRTLTLIAAAASIFAACTGGQDKSPADELMTRIEKSVRDGKILYGHQDALMYGHEWNQSAQTEDFTRSDVKDVTGAYPVVYGLDLGGIEHMEECNLDGNPFEDMRASVIAHYERGGIITLSWHADNPLTGGNTWDVSSNEVVASILPKGNCHGLFMEWLSNMADFIESLKTKDGEIIPVIFRPWHEHTGSWFWWGRNLCTVEEYQALWAMTYDYLEVERGLDNLVWCYSPGAGNTEQVYMERYPGDEMVDMLGVDCYQYNTDEQYISDVKTALDFMTVLGKSKNKIIAFTETGYEGIPDPMWWTDVLYPAIKDYPIAYVLTWRNAWDRPEHFYAPYPKSMSADNFKAFHDLDHIEFLKVEE